MAVAVWYGEVCSGMARRVPAVVVRFGKAGSVSRGAAGLGGQG